MRREDVVRVAAARRGASVPAAGHRDGADRQADSLDRTSSAATAPSRALAFYRWSRDAGWRDALYVITYPIRTWRCRLFGHKWGPEKSDYDVNIGARLESWRECERRGCEGWWQTFHYLGGERIYG